ncbi:hypothetical protein SD457_13480 [Coprobacillaceae bacterium CR2/5/TPMF4]|nr:hypothetical protein SD457_13480 [Coprobacillaceae bacterium CR2/5/TPMF4]
MFRKIRRTKSEISVEEAKILLKNNKRAAFSVNGDNGYPFTIPINFITMKMKIKFIFIVLKVVTKLILLKLVIKSALQLGMMVILMRVIGPTMYQVV